MLLSLLVPGSGAQDGPDLAEFRYAHGFAATGAFEGECAVAGFHPRVVLTADLVLGHEGGELRILETRQNRTILHPDVEPGQVIWEPAKQIVRQVPLAAGELRIQFRPESSLHGLALESWEQGALRAEFAGGQLDSGAIAASHPYGPDYPEAYRDIVAFVHQGIPGWSRSVRSPGAGVDLAGDLQLRMDSVRIVTPKGAHELPGYWTSENVTDLRPAVYRDTMVFTYAVVDVRGVNARLDSDAFGVYCGDFAWHGDGTVTLRTAHGRVTRGDKTLSFERQELTLAGALSFDEQPEVVPHGVATQGWVRGNAEGRFDAMGLDFEAVPLGAASWPVEPATVGLFALILAAVGGVLVHSGRFVGLFFSRFDPDSAPRHPTRALILDVVKARPGISMPDLAAEAQVNYSVLRHHLQVLLMVGLVKTLRSHYTKHVYYRTESLAEARKSLALVQDEMVSFLVLEARKQPLDRRAAQALLRDRFGVSRVGAWKAVGRAVSAGILQVDGSSGGEFLRPAAAA